LESISKKRISPGFGLPDPHDWRYKLRGKVPKWTTQ